MPSGYASVDGAAAAAQMRINSMPDVEQNEYIGLIYQDSKTGKYLFTEPVTLGAASGKDRARGSFSVPGGRAAVRGIIHNHPSTMGMSQRRLSLLSGDDIDQAEQLDVPSYIVNGNSLLRWTGKTKGRGRSRRGVTEEVLAQIPIQEIKQAFDAAMAARKDPSIGNMFTGKK